MTGEIANEWSKRFGLAHVPLFGGGEVTAPERHAALLDGGYGSFIVSELAKEEFDIRQTASWAWSSDFPHHVALVSDEVVVTRWDRISPERFTLKSISGKLDAFYDYLVKDRIVGKQGVVPRLLDLFRAVRGEVQRAGAADSDAISSFLAVLARLVSVDQSSVTAAGHVPTLSTVWTGSSGAAEALPLSADQIARLEAGFKQQVSELLNFDLHAALAVRHAASALFQEAHFTFESSDQGDLFAHQPANSVRKSRGSHHFTPAPLARSVVEQVLHAAPYLLDRTNLVVCDPACGSGAFLTEILRTLRRAGFKGHLRLVGRDISQSAVVMARFALTAATHDWSPEGGVEIDIIVGDALTSDALPVSDIVAMNPPFLSWPMMNAVQREQVSQVLGVTARHRPDLCMAFMSKALSTLTEGGVVAALVPTSILNLQSGKEWRKSLLEQAHLAFLGSFGDYGLFVHALVQVSAMVLVNGPSQINGVALRALNHANATGEALRALRRLSGPAVTGASGAGWRISPIDLKTLRLKSRWQILPESLERALTRFKELNAPTVETFFEVHQGIRTGCNQAFILDERELAALPPGERKYFRPTIFRDAITDGRVSAKYHLFFPYGATGLSLDSEADLAAKLPTYFDQYIAPNKVELAKRSGVGSPDVPWWALSRFYRWTLRRDPRLVSKYFGGSGSFALDAGGKFIPVQAHALFLKSGAINASARKDKRLLTRVLSGYGVLFNSMMFERLLRVFSEPVAGGQFDLSPRFIDNVPLPNLFEPTNGELLDALIELSSAEDFMSANWLARVENICRVAWGAPLADALLEFDDG